jgi:hypothetical protein
MPIWRHSLVVSQLEFFEGDRGRNQDHLTPDEVAVISEARFSGE